MNNKKILVLILVIIVLASILINWYTGNKKMLIKPYSLSETPSTKQTAIDWSGVWDRQNSSASDGARITISHETPSSFSFFIDVISGTNFGDISGTAQKKEGMALFNISNEFSDWLCEGTFQLRGSVLTLLITQPRGCNAGLGVYFDGDYIYRR